MFVTEQDAHQSRAWDIVAWQAGPSPPLRRDDRA
jgi:hypothetical protein